MTAPHTLLLMWDCLGLEYCEDITRREQAEMWASLQGKESNLGTYPSLNALVLRARFNPQRNYEIYTISIDHTLTAADIKAEFEANPQGMVDLVRERGHKIYSDRAQNQNRVIV